MLNENNNNNSDSLQTTPIPISFMMEKRKFDSILDQTSPGLTRSVLGFEVSGCSSEKWGLLKHWQKLRGDESERKTLKDNCLLLSNPIHSKDIEKEHMNSGSSTIQVTLSVNSGSRTSREQSYKLDFSPRTTKDRTTTNKYHNLYIEIEENETSTTKIIENHTMPAKVQTNHQYYHKREE